MVFKATILHCKATLGRGRLGRMRDKYAENGIKQSKHSVHGYTKSLSLSLSLPLSLSLSNTHTRAHKHTDIHNYTQTTTNNLYIKTLHVEMYTKKMCI